MHMIYFLFSKNKTRINNFLSILISQNCMQNYRSHGIYEGWNFNGGNYLFTTDTK